MMLLPTNIELRMIYIMLKTTVRGGMRTLHMSMANVEKEKEVFIGKTGIF